MLPSHKQTFIICAMQKAPRQRLGGRATTIHNSPSYAFQFEIFL